MRILQVCKKFPYPLIDGERIAIYQLYKGLQQAGANITIASINTKKHYTNIENISPSIFDNKIYYSKTIDTTPTSIGFLKSWIKGSSYNIDRFYNKEFEQQLIKILKETSFDIIQLEGMFLYPYIKAIRKNTKAKIVLRSHNIEHRILDRNLTLTKAGLKKVLWRMLQKRMQKTEKLILKEVDAIVPISEIDALWYRENRFLKPLHVTMTGFDKPEQVSHQFNEKLQLYYLGSMDWLPNVEGVKWFIKNVWVELLKEKLPLNLYLPLFTNSEKWFSDIRDIIWVEKVEDVNVFISGKDILVVPLFSGSGIRIKIPEAMNHGRVVISTSIGAEGLGLNSGQEFLLADDATTFIKLIKQLSLNRSQLEQLSVRGFNTCRQRFDTLKLASELLQFYQTLLQC